MKILSTGLFTILATLGFSPVAAAESSVCEVFIANDEVYTTCDGKQLGSVIKIDNGTVVAVTKAIQRVQAKGFTLKTCSGKSSEQVCFLTK